MAMSKKKLKELMKTNEPKYLSVISSIETEILLFLQLETRNNIVLDINANNTPLLYQNKFINYPKESLQNKNIIPFDIFGNIKLMQFLFTLYIRNYQIENNKQIQQFFLTPLTQDGYGAVVIRPDYNSQDIESGMYKNETLRYIDLILKNEMSFLYNESMLHELDIYLDYIKEERLINRKDV